MGEDARVVTFRCSSTSLSQSSDLLTLLTLQWLSELEYDDPTHPESPDIPDTHLDTP
jgi:hypothetical protein